MLELLTDPQAWISLATLALLEIVLGIDNIVFIAILASKLPEHQQALARQLGLMAALVTRLALLGGIAWLTTLTAPLFTVFDVDLSARDLILIGGGLFLLAKGTREIHHTVEGGGEGHLAGPKSSLLMVVIQIGIIDIVFSLDSVITAVGMAKHIEIMVAAIVLAMAVMLVAAGPVSAFVQRHLSVKMLALSFLLLIGVALVADGLHFHIPKEYLYFAVAFSLVVEMLNLWAARHRSKSRRVASGG